MMKLVTMTDQLSKRFGLKEAIKMIKDFGFDAYDCSLSRSMLSGYEFSGDDYVERAREIRAFADSIGLPCTQTHTPCPCLRKYSDIENCIEDQKKAIEISAILGAEIAVVHPSQITDVIGNWDMLYSKLLPIAKELGVKIATENMFAWKDKTEIETVPSACGNAKDFVRYVDFVNDDNFTACFDIGHSEMVNCEGAVKIIHALGHDRISALHVHDNDCWHDDHIFPFAGKINWEKVCRALADIDYKGNFTFEADSFFSRFPNEIIPEALTLLEKTGRHLIAMIESYKNN